MSLRGSGWELFTQEYPVNVTILQGSILGPTISLLHINDLPDDVRCDIAIYFDDTALYSKCYQASDLWQQLELASENCHLNYETLWTEARSGFFISMLRKFNWFCLNGLTTLVLFLRKNHLLRC